MGNGSQPSDNGCERKLLQGGDGLGRQYGDVKCILLLLLLSGGGARVRVAEGH